MKNVAHFEAAGRAFLKVLSGISADQWENPGLGVWTVRSLAGHTSRAISTVDEYLSLPAPENARYPDAESYFLSFLDAPVRDDVAARGVAAGELLGPSPLGVVTRSLDRTLAAIAHQPSGRIVSVAGGRAIPLEEYLRTRTFELVVHTIDLASATGLPHSFPEEVVSDAAALAARIASRQGKGSVLLLALTGRQPLPDGFSVV